MVKNYLVNQKYIFPVNFLLINVFKAQQNPLNYWENIFNSLKKYYYNIKTNFYNNYKKKMNNWKNKTENIKIYKQKMEDIFIF